MVNSPQDGLAHLVVTNMSGLTQRMAEGTIIGEAQIAEVLTSEPSPVDATSANVRRLSSSQDEERRKKLLQLQEIPESDAEQLRTFLANNHDVFSLKEGECGETRLTPVMYHPGSNHRDACRSWFMKKLPDS